MLPSQLRRQILRGHDELRELLELASHLADHVRQGEAGMLGPLIQTVEQIEAFLIRVIDEEDLLLPEALLEADAWGQVRIERMERYHHQQRRAVDVAMREVRAERLPPERLAEEVQDLVSELNHSLHMAERVYLHRDVLRDDPMTIRQTSG